MSDNTLGNIIFTGIEKNEYLNEIYESILQNYSIKLLSIKNQQNKQFDINHALRFADVLSNSFGTKNSEKHKVWAQEIVSLLYDLYPNNETVKYYFGAVLSNICNYRGLSFSNSNYKPISLLDELYETYKKEALKISSLEDGYFFKSQKDVYDGLSDNAFSYSGPTSMGKSFVIRMFIKERIMNNEKMNFVIVVPTKALINEVSSKIINDLNDSLADADYRVVTAIGVTYLQQEHNFIFVLTPERLLYFLLGNPNFKIDYLFIDEAHKISSKDNRSAIYYKVVDILSKRSEKPHFIFSSPNIPNPEVYLNLIDGDISNASYFSSFSPVSQIKYVVDLVDNRIQLHNDYKNTFMDIAYLQEHISLTRLIRGIGRNKKNIVYCSSTSRAVNYALAYSKDLPEVKDDNELKSLSKLIKNTIHNDYYLADLLLKGIAYHIGYLPSDIRMRIEELYRNGNIHTLFCTSTLVEGVNLPADNLFITHYRNGRSNMTSVDFKNLIGRVGRIEYNLYGNVFLVRMDNKVDTKKYIELIENDPPEQKLSIETELKKSQKKMIVESLLAGNIELPHIPKSQPDNNYLLMRKFAIILLNDILANRDSFVKRMFSDYIDNNIEDSIRKAFSNIKSDDDINVSSDQMSNLYEAISKGLSYPKFKADGKIDYNELMAFLENLCRVYKWEKYESTTLGHVSQRTHEHGKLTWYGVILLQWMSGHGLSIIMENAIKYKQNNPSSGVEVDGRIVEYDDSVFHKNMVIASTLNAIEDVILFRLSNYFLRFSTEYKKFHNIDSINNDWYEFVEYGTTDMLSIFFQKNGFSRESATFIKKNKEDYLCFTEDGYKLYLSLLECENRAVCKEAKEIKYNIPELFI